MKLNHFICPNCNHDFYAEGAYATCDACNTFFYAAQSRTCNHNQVTKPIIVKPIIVDAMPFPCGTPASIFAPRVTW